MVCLWFVGIQALNKFGPSSRCISNCYTAYVTALFHEDISIINLVHIANQIDIKRYFFAFR